MLNYNFLNSLYSSVDVATINRFSIIKGNVFNV